MLELSAFYQSSNSQNVAWPSEENGRFINSFLVGHIEEDKFVTYNSIGPCRDSFLNMVHKKVASAPTSKLPIAYIYNYNSGEDIIKKINEPRIIKEFNFKPFFLLFHTGTRILKLAGIIGGVNVFTYKDPLFFWHYTELLRYKCSGYSKVYRDGTFYGTPIYDKFLNSCFYNFENVFARDASQIKHMGIKDVEIIGVNSPFIFYNTLLSYPGYLAKAYCEKQDLYSINTKTNYLELMNAAHPLLTKVDYNGWTIEELKTEFTKLLKSKSVKKVTI